MMCHARGKLCHSGQVQGHEWGSNLRNFYVNIYFRYTLQIVVDMTDM